MLSLRVSRDKRGYDHIYLLLETRRKGRTVTRLLYGGRWPSPMKIGQQPLDEATRKALEQAHPEVTFDWVALQRTLQQALATPRAPMTPETRRRRASEGRSEGRPSGGPGGGGQSQGQGGRAQHGPGRVPPTSRPQQMPPRQRPPYAGPGDRDDRGDEQRQASSLDDTADLPYDAMAEPDADVVDVSGRPYDEPILEEGLETEARRGGLSEMAIGPEEIEPVEERTFVVSTDDDDTDSGDRPPIADEPADDRGEFEHAKFERPDLPGPGFTRDEFPIATADRPEEEQGGAGAREDVTAGFGLGPGAPDVPGGPAGPGGPGGPGGATDPSAPPRRRRRRRRGRRSHGGQNAAPQQGGGLTPETSAGPDDADSESDGPDDHDDDSDV